MSFSIIALHCQSYHFPILSFLLPPLRLLLFLKDQNETFFTFYLCAGHVLNMEFCFLSWFIQDPITVVLQHFSSNKEVDFFQTDSAVLSFQFYKKLNYWRQTALRRQKWLLRLVKVRFYRCLLSSLLPWCPLFILWDKSEVKLFCHLKYTCFWLVDPYLYLPLDNMMDEHEKKNHPGYLWRDLCPSCVAKGQGSCGKRYRVLGN